jgi:hypothetical protein
MKKKKDVLWNHLGAIANNELSAKNRELQKARPKVTLKKTYTMKQIHRMWRDWAKRYKDVSAELRARQSREETGKETSDGTDDMNAMLAKGENEVPVLQAIL